ncbi:MAG: glycosyltransferase family 4 protein [Ferruginibacter sp.]|nr:glycosyltransferase family 4 protein [Ferruginibacter sp.]
MKILLATWSWYPVGGDWTYVENVKRLYESHGIEVIPFSTYNEKNISSEYDHYFVKAYDYKELNKSKGIITGFKALKNSVVSVEALKKIDKLLDEHQIDFAHLHIIHHWVTPAIIKKLKKRNIPVIWTLHEYKILCPEGTFVSNGKVCEKCINGKFYNCALQKCKKKSFLASTLAAIDAYYYRFSGVYKKVDLYLCPSDFLRKKFIQFGFPENKMRLTNYCYDIEFIDQFYNKYFNTGLDLSITQVPYVLYVGRIEKLKGIKTLIDAVRGTNIQLKIAGTGAALVEMQSYVSDNGLSNIEFLGFQNKERVYELTINSLFVVCPSEWYENYPFSVIESLLLHKPVIGSDMGGIPELIIDGETGFIHKAGDSNMLRNQMLKLWTDPSLAKQMGVKARAFIVQKVNFQTHWEVLKKLTKEINVPMS